MSCNYFRFVGDVIVSHHANLSKMCKHWGSFLTHCRWLYRLFLGLDANFCLKRLNVSKNTDDPGLNQGCAYFINDTSFRKYLQEYDDKIPNDHSTCSNYDAIKLASMQGGNGTTSTRVDTVKCICHDMKRLASVGDLQKGEWQAFTSFLCAELLKSH